MEQVKMGDGHDPVVDPILKESLEEFEGLDKEFADLDMLHQQYMAKVTEVKALQKKCVNGIAHQRYRFKVITDKMKKIENSGDPGKKGVIRNINEKISERKTHFHEMEEYLPHKNGLYLRIILGQVNVSLLSKEDRFAYKKNYEDFKLILTIIQLVISFFLLTFINNRWIDSAFHFLMVWYYCTLTIREGILKVNGSRIKGWWVLDHFIWCALAGIVLIWPHRQTYSLFRNQFMMFASYVNFVSIIQYSYQKGCLYRLRAMGERHNMDITMSGFHSWMWKGLSFLLPFLVGAYIFQLYNAYTLFLLSYHDGCTEWQVPALALIFFTLFAGNTITLLAVIRQKMKKDGLVDSTLRNKYRFNHIKPE